MNRKTILTSIGGVVGLGILWAVGSWMLVGRYHVSTDNAYVRADITMVAAKTEGYVRKIDAHDNAKVLAGASLVILDPRDSQASVSGAVADLARDKAHAALARAQASRIASDAKVIGAEADA